MYLNKLVTVLTAMEVSSLQRLEEYIHSPFFRVQPTVVSMFDYFAEQYPHYSDENINLKAIAKYTKSKTKHRQEIVATRLMSAIFDFIALSQWQKDEYNSFLPLVQGLKELELYSFADTELRRAMDLINEDIDQDVDVFYLRHVLTADATTSFDMLLQRNAQNNISTVTETLEQFYALKVLRIVCESINRKKLVGTEFYINSMAKVLDILTPLTTPKYPYVWVYMNVYKLLTAETFEEGRKAYFRIEYMIKRNGEQSLQPYLLDGIQYCINWSLQWYSKGYAEAAQYYLWWIDFKIKHNLMLNQNQIQPISFRNPIVVAVGYRSPEWIQQFIEQFAPHLPETIRSINTTFAEALLAYYKKDFSGAARLFQQISAKGEPVFNVIIRRWQFMNLWEFNNTKSFVLKRTLSAFEKYLHRNNAQLPMRQIFAKFIHYSAHIMNPPEDLGGIEYVKIRLAKEPFFPGKDWLEKQLEKQLLVSPKCV